MAILIVLPFMISSAFAQSPGTISITPPPDGTWSSGEELRVTLNQINQDNDPLTDEDLDLFNPNAEAIPAITVGSPFTIQNINSVSLSGTALNAGSVIQPYSGRVMLQTPVAISLDGNDELVLTLNQNFGSLYNSINDPNLGFSGFNFLNYDVRSLTAISVDIEISDGVNTSTFNSLGADGMIDLTTATGDSIFSMNPASLMEIKFIFTNTPDNLKAGHVFPMVVDFFSFGFYNDGSSVSDRVNNMIARLELEETGDNTGSFIGYVEYVMLTQLNILDSDTYAGLESISNEVIIVVNDNFTDEDAVRVIYHDITGIGTTLSDTYEAPTHTGTISFDQNEISVNETVISITIDDMDLNEDADLIDIITVVSPQTYPSDPAKDTAGREGLGYFINGEPFGKIFELSFNDQKWTSGIPGGCGSAGTPDDGLSASGFALIETGPDDGIFIGDFQMPTTFCNTQNENIEQVEGSLMAIEYLDFRDASGQIVLSNEILGSNQSPEWELEGEELVFGDGVVEIPENLDVYFSSIGGLENKLKQLNFPPNQYSVENLPLKPLGDYWVLTKKIQIETFDKNEFDRIFDNDPLASNIQFYGNTVNENYLNQQAITSLESCSQNLTPVYCNNELQDIENMITERIGTHVVTESIVLGTVKVNSKNSQIDVSSLSSIIPLSYSGFGNSIEQFNVNFPSSNMQMNEIVLENIFIPKAMAQSGSDGDLPYSNNFLFLNGFTIGYGYGKSWDYQYKIFDYVAFSVDVHTEVGLGIGLRIPIDATLNIDEGLDNNREFEAKYTVNTRDLNENEYVALGLGVFQGFEGKEFNMYLGPAASISVELFGENLFAYERGITKPDARDFAPPLGNERRQFTSFEIDLLCDVASTCIDSDLAEVTITAAVSGEIAADKITMESVPTNRNNVDHAMTFSHNGQTLRSHHNTDQNYAFSTELQNVKYFSNLHFVPKVTVGVSTALFPINISVEPFDFPEIKVPDIILEAHANTQDQYLVDPIIISGGTRGPSVPVSGTSYTVEYSITNGEINRITPDEESSSLIIEISSTNQGELTITLPRKLIDSKLSNGNDGSFFVLINGVETAFLDMTTSTERTLTIPFEFGAEEIEIIGTFVVPEFGSIVLIVLMISLISVILMQKFSNNAKLS